MTIHRPNHKPGQAWRGAVGLAVLILVAGSACNMVSGADEIVLEYDDDDDDGSSSSAEQASSSATGGGAGTGPTSTAESSAMANSASHTTGVGGNTAVATTTTSTGEQTGPSTGSGPVECEYPQGPYGLNVGQVVPAGLSWQGYAPGSNGIVTVTIDEFFDCDGSRGIHALVFDTSQYG